MSSSWDWTSPSSPHRWGTPWDSPLKAILIKQTLWVTFYAGSGSEGAGPQGPYWIIKILDAREKTVYPGANPRAGRQGPA